MIPRWGASPPERGGPESIAADALVLGCIPAVAGVLGPLQCHSLEGRWPPVILFIDRIQPRRTNRPLVHPRVCGVD